MSPPDPAAAPSPPIPVTVIGGYLGAGKTTLVNRLLAGDHGLRLAVLVNDFGAVNIDAGLIAAHEGDTISLQNGCVCCAMTGDLTEALTTLAARRPRPEHIVVEAIGVADPARIALYAYGWPELRLDGVLTLADAETVRARAGDKFVGSTVRRQLAGADLLVANKCDLLAEDALPALRDWLHAAAPEARMIATSQADLPWSLVLGLGAGETTPPASRPELEAADTLFESLIWRPKDALARDDLSAMLTALPDAVYRVKGWLALRERPGGLTLVQAVGRRIDIADDRPPEPERSPGLLLIHRRDDNVRRQVEAVLETI